MTSCKKLLGKRIKELRKRNRITQEQLSELIGLEPNHISKIESGIHFPQPDKLELIAKIFRVSVMELFDYEHKQSNEYIKQKISEWLKTASDKEVEYIYKTILNIKDLK
ncbi:MAG: helix-turn-helix domain-containing protein [Muribaculaceae bacterium]|nr:helix-turn-helix domain-containing protein [Muribaculaceae bacterium]